MTRMRGQNSYGKKSYSEYSSNGSKRRNPSKEKTSFSIGSEDTVFRYICPVSKIGSIIGRGGDVVNQLRNDTKAKIKIGDTIPGCDDRVVTIYSPADATNPNEYGSSFISPAQDALFRVHDRVVDDDLYGDDEYDGSRPVTARLLIPFDQIGCIIGRGGEIVQNIRSETGAQIRIQKDVHMPICALNSVELVQISGDALLVKKALYQIASRLNDNPSRSQHVLASASSAYPLGGSYVTPASGAPLIALISLVVPHGRHRSDAGDWSRSYNPATQDDISPREFSLRLVCRTANIGSVIGKGGVTINHIRRASGAHIKVDSSAEGEDTLIIVTANEDTSPVTEAAVALQPRCNDKSEREAGIVSFTTRMFVPSSRIGCLIGKGGKVITELRKLTKADVRIPPKENLPKIAAEDDEMVLISGDIVEARDALIQIISLLRAKLFDREGEVPTCLPIYSCIPGSYDTSDRSRYGRRDRDRGSKRNGCVGPSYHEPNGSPTQMSSVRGGAFGAYGSSHSSGGYRDRSR